MANGWRVNARAGRDGWSVEWELASMAGVLYGDLAAACVRGMCPEALPARGILAPDDAAMVMQTFFDVLVGAWRIGLPLGTRAVPAKAEIAAQANRAVEVAGRLLRPE